LKLLPDIQLTRNLERFREVVSVLTKYGLADWISRLDLEFAKGWFKSADRQRLADLSLEARIRLALSDLGTTFIKLGQVLSTRADLVGPALATELAKLRDDVQADPPEVVKKTVEAELGRPLLELFSQFDMQPLASASIGQVHAAKLPSGRAVVVKVQHPGIESRIRSDLDILHGLADLAERALSEVRHYQPKAITAEFQRVLLRELDFGREVRNIRQFSANFDDDPTVHFPATHLELSTTRVLTMERLEGVPITDAGKLEKLGYDSQEIARRGATVFLEMIFRDGFYHADPHPGNLTILEGGRIGILDCGMIGRVDEALREDIEDMLFSIASRDSTQLTATIIRIGQVPPELDRSSLSAEVADYLADYGGQSMEEFDLSGALTELTGIIRRYHVILPSRVALLIRVFIVLEGTAHLLSPQFNLVELVQGYYKSVLWRRFSPRRRLQKLARQFREWEQLGELLPRSVADLLRQAQGGKFSVHIAHNRLESTVNRLVFGLVCSALFLGSSLLWSLKVPPLLWDVPVLGVAGCVLSFALGLRLLWAIKKSGHLDRTRDN
jgi:ubiquinone biosynthesis protein